MKARFNYDLKEVKEMIMLARAAHGIEVPQPSVDNVATQSLILEEQRKSDRSELISRVEHLTQLMEEQREKAKAAQSNLRLGRVLNLLKAS